MPMMAVKLGLERITSFCSWLSLWPTRPPHHLHDVVLLLVHIPQEVTAMATVRRQGRRPQPGQHGTKARMWRSGQCIDDAGETMLRRGSVGVLNPLGRGGSVGWYVHEGCWKATVLTVGGWNRPAAVRWRRGSRTASMREFGRGEKTGQTEKRTQRHRGPPDAWHRELAGPAGPTGPNKVEKEPVYYSMLLYLYSFTPQKNLYLVFAKILDFIYIYYIVYLLIIQCSLRGG